MSSSYRTATVQRSKSLGRDHDRNKKVYAFGSSTPRELSHLNLPRHLRIASSKLGEALQSSPVKRMSPSGGPPRQYSSPTRRQASPKRKPTPDTKKPIKKRELSADATRSPPSMTGGRGRPVKSNTHGESFILPPSEPNQPEPGEAGEAPLTNGDANLEPINSPNGSGGQNDENTAHGESDSGIQEGLDGQPDGDGKFTEGSGSDDTPMILKVQHEVNGTPDGGEEESITIGLEPAMASPGGEGEVDGDDDGAQSPHEPGDERRESDEHMAGSPPTIGVLSPEKEGAESIGGVSDHASGVEDNEEAVDEGEVGSEHAESDKPIEAELEIDAADNVDQAEEGEDDGGEEESREPHSPSEHASEDAIGEGSTHGETESVHGGDQAQTPSEHGGSLSSKRSSVVGSGHQHDGDEGVELQQEDEGAGSEGANDDAVEGSNGEDQHDETLLSPTSDHGSHGGSGDHETKEEAEDEVAEESLIDKAEDLMSDVAEGVQETFNDVADAGSKALGSLGSYVTGLMPSSPGDKDDHQSVDGEAEENEGKTETDQISMEASQEMYVEQDSTPGAEHTNEGIIPLQDDDIEEGALVQQIPVLHGAEAEMGRDENDDELKVGAQASVEDSIGSPAGSTPGEKLTPAGVQELDDDEKQSEKSF